MGGVVELNTLRMQPDFQGEVVLSGGSFDSACAFDEGQYVWGGIRSAEAQAAA